MIHREPGQARKGAATAIDSCAGMWLVELPPDFHPLFMSLFRVKPVDSHKWNTRWDTLARSTAYLQLSSHSVYYFRIRVPKACRKTISQTYIRRSLKTKCRRIAIVRGAVLLQQFIELFLKAERGLSVQCQAKTKRDL